MEKTAAILLTDTMELEFAPDETNRVADLAKAITPTINHMISGQK